MKASTVLLFWTPFAAIQAAENTVPSPQLAREMLLAGREVLAHRLAAATTPTSQRPDDETGVELILALSALASTSSGSTDPHAPAIAAGRDWLRSQQAADGSFLMPPVAVEATWYALNACRGSTHQGDQDAANKAADFLRLRSQRGPSLSPAAVGENPIAEALQFLQNNSASRRQEPRTATPLDDASSLAFGSHAGSAFDLRAARQLLWRDPETSLTAQLGLPSRGGKLQDVHLAARVLADSGNPRLVDERGQTRLWPQEYLLQIAALRSTTKGCWSLTAHGNPSVAATAASVLALAALEPWLVTIPEASLDAASSREQAEVAVLPTDCVDCHDKLHPGIVHQWRQSRHAGVDVGCETCHGKNHSQIFRDNGAVSPRVCGSCHAQQVAEFAGSKHATAETTLLRSALFAATPVENRASCRSCHATGKAHADGAFGGCNFCHSAHSASSAEAREPEACTGCHTGKDYPQELAYRLSRHGAIYYPGRDSRLAPTCVTCHQPGGNHGTSFGITLGGIGTGGHLALEEPAVPMEQISAERFVEERAAMVRVCVTCHTSRFAEDSLLGADRLKHDGNRTLLAARKILLDLHADGLLGPAGSPPPLLGDPQVRLDPHVRGSAALNRFYEMWRFHYAWTWKGAYHSSPSVANLESGPGLDADLDFIRSEATRLRQQGKPR